MSDIGPNLENEIRRAVYVSEVQMVAPVILKVWQEKNAIFKQIKNRGSSVTRNEFEEMLANFLTGVQYVHGHTGATMNDIKFIDHLPMLQRAGSTIGLRSHIGYFKPHDTVYISDDAIELYAKMKRDKKRVSSTDIQDVTIGQYTMLTGVEEAVHAVDHKDISLLEKLPGATDPSASMVSHFGQVTSPAELHYAFDPAEQRAKPIVAEAQRHFARNAIGAFKATHIS